MNEGDRKAVDVIHFINVTSRPLCSLSLTLSNDVTSFIKSILSIVHPSSLLHPLLRLDSMQYTSDSIQSDSDSMIYTDCTPPYSLSTPGSSIAAWPRMTTLDDPTNQKNVEIGAVRFPNPSASRILDSIRRRDKGKVGEGRRKED